MVTRQQFSPTLPRAGYALERAKKSFGQNNGPRKLELFLNQLSQGASITKAAEAAGISRRILFEWRNIDPDFAVQWVEAADEGVDRLEDEARRRAVDGVEKPVFQGGTLVGTITEYSDSLMALLLRGKRPETYRDNVSIKSQSEVVSRNLNVNVDLTTMSTEDLLRLYKEEVSGGYEG